MKRRDFLKKTPCVLGATTALATGVAWADPTAGPRRGSTLDELNQYIKTVWFPHRERRYYHGVEDRFHKVLKEGVEIHHVYFTGLKPSPRSTLVSGQWIAVPYWSDSPSWYSNVTLTVAELQGFAPIRLYQGDRPAGPFFRGEMFNTALPPTNAPTTDLQHQLAEALVYLEFLVQQERMR